MLTLFILFKLLYTAETVTCIPMYIGFKSLRAAPKVPELVPFEKELFEMVKNIKYNDQRGKRSKLQRRLLKDVATIKKQTKVIVASDKTSNFCLVDTNSYRNMINRDIQKVYRKAGDEEEKDINEKAKVIATKLELEDRIFATQKRQASITALCCLAHSCAIFLFYLGGEI